MPVFVLLSRHAQSGKSSFIFKECPRTIALAVVRAMHQWYLATSRQKTKAWICTTSIPSWTHWFLRFVRVSLRGVTSLSNPGVWDLTHWSQEARWGAARRAGPGQTVWDLPRSSEFVPPGTVEFLIQHGRKLKVCTATMQPNARQVLLPGDRSLIEACLACELHLKVVWHGWTAWAEWKCPFSCQIYKSTRLQDDATSWPSFAWSHCEIDICQLMILQFKVWPGWPSSGWQVVYKWCFSFGICIGQFPWHFFRQGPASTRRGHSSSWNQAKRWPVVADGWKRRDRQLTSSDLFGNISGISSSDFDFCKMDSCHLMCLACKSCIR